MPQDKTPNGTANRHRKAHRKSRGGCRNCKLRRVKCDESKPSCTQCTSYGVTCNYHTSSSVSDLQMRFGGPVSMSLDAGESCIVPFKPYPRTASTAKQRVQLPLPLLFSTQMPVYFPGNPYGLDPDSAGRLTRFKTRTSLSISTPTGAFVFQQVTTDLALSHPYLMHVLQTLTSVHDRYLSPTPLPRATPTEIHHLSLSASLFNTKLSSPISPPDRDPIWATAALLGILAFAWTDATSASESWPLAPANPSDLEWMKMSENKIAVFNLTNPMRANSVFRPVSADFLRVNGAVAIPERGVEGIPDPFVKVLGLGDGDDELSSPYFKAMHVLARLLPLMCDRTRFVTFLRFVTHLTPGFKRLLQDKDARALLMLAWWFAKVCRGVWWIERRARLECQAICIFLGDVCRGDRDVELLLRWPRERCGLDSGEIGPDLDLDWVSGMR
ncbi:hypothetical protein BKA61DRAFT_499294 [Leptodontidium sp. MPI-SDFR-AT-0119]|nr:hypothetical protein BKA61DRAFT_499294 [Leptodontidium sp. MPI-SDFR-AT-0119]